MVEPKYTLALPTEQKPTKTEKKPYVAPEIEIVTEPEQTEEKQDEVLKEEVKAEAKAEERTLTADNPKNKNVLVSVEQEAEAVLRLCLLMRGER